MITSPTTSQIKGKKLYAPRLNPLDTCRDRQLEGFIIADVTEICKIGQDLSKPRYRCTNGNLVGEKRYLVEYENVVTAFSRDMRYEVH